ncbi:MAG: septum site-determining protein MinC [Rudaea sp.]|uniref:septum site-determining protein MinC n=1 Tax=Rudaea sp. TaxID=2136325 RepID=UPI0039E36B19
MRATAAAVEPILELKFGQVGIANLRLNVNDAEALRAEIEQKVSAAPQLFGRAPVILDLSRLPQLPNAVEAQALLDAIRAAGMLPVALSYSTTENEALAKELGLPLLAKFRTVYERQNADETVANIAPATSRPKPVAKTTEEAPPPAPRPSSLFQDKAVRSGQQVYARGRDLIVNATVGNGAEVIADGSIHVYGRLCGRALAGAQGDATARIYCMDFQAELVSIAGRYRVFEDLPKQLRGKSVQAWLDGEKLLVEALAP